MTTTDPGPTTTELLLLISQQNVRIDGLVTGLNTRIDSLAGRMDTLAARMDGLSTNMRTGFERVNDRLDEIHASLAELRQRYDWHERHLHGYEPGGSTE